METLTPAPPPPPPDADAAGPLRQQLEAARRTISVLMDRIENSAAASPNANGLNMNSLALQEIVRQRTRSLQQMNEGLIQSAIQHQRINRILGEMQRIASIGGWELDVDSGAIEFTEQMLVILELPPGINLTVASFCQAFTAEDGARLHEHIQAAHRLRRPFDLELRAGGAPRRDKVFRVVGYPVNKESAAARLYGVIQDITQRKQADFELQSSNTRLLEISHRHELILNSITEGIHWVGRDGRIVFENPASARLLGWDVAELIGKPAHATMHHLMANGSPNPIGDCPIYRGMITGIPCRVNDEVFSRKDGSTFPVDYSSTPVRDQTGTIVGTVVVFSDITQRRKAEADLEQTNTQLIKVSRMAGMAEVATGVLHNVGNVLNSVNVSSSLVTDKIRKSKVATLGKIAALLRDHQADLADFITADPQGKLVPAYLMQLADHLAAEQSNVVTELEHLQRNVEHIKEIVSTQQAYASSAGFVESLDVRESLEDALRMTAASLARHAVVVVRQFEDVPFIPADRHKVLQILVNLIRNAKQAMAGMPVRTLTLSAQPSAEGGVRVCVRDTGCGIAAENMTRVFAHGFTTKADGHGFGLHSSALAAKEFGGSLEARSDGPGMGASFCLTLPLHRELHAHVL